MTQSLLSVFLAAALVTAPVYADDGFDFIGGGGQTEKAVEGQAEKPVKAPREVNPFTMMAHPMVKAGATGLGLAFLGPIGAIGVPIATLMFAKGEINDVAKINAFYTGTVVRGKLTKIHDNTDLPGWEKSWGVVLNTAPVRRSGDFVVLQLSVEGPIEYDRVVVARKDSGYEVGDILDAKTALGTYALQPTVNKDVKLDFNKHMPRVVNVYCKHNNASCQNDYDSSLGVLYRHQDTEFPPSQYLIDPAIIAADQERMRKEEADKKAAKNAGGFSFL